MVEQNKDRFFQKSKGLAGKVFKIVALIGLIYLFLVSVELLGESFESLGEGVAKAFLETVSNPMLGLFVGIFTTSLVQSSSMTTSLVVGLVAGGAFGTDPEIAIQLAIPIIMGANIGTSVTGIIVSLGHISRKDEFERAFSASIVHDFFNLLAVATILPLQIAFNLLGRIAYAVEKIFEGAGGLEMSDPLGRIIDPVVRYILSFLSDIEWVGIIIALLLLFISLRYLVKTMRSLMLSKIELFFDRYLFKNTITALSLGTLFTAIVQSSSITTSLVIPLAGAGVLTIQQIYPYALGANVGTTVTTLLAALATGNPVSVTIAISHLFFNLVGISIWLPLKKIPITLARKFAEITKKFQFFPFIYIIVTFFLIPLLLILIVR
jgi:sodium-dependent phosphate cotransporter